jgi:uncharacterized membrane protein (DUF106 family)
MVQAEFVKLQERCDSMQGQLGKALRDRETAVAELEIARERLDKSQQQLQKLQACYMCLYLSCHISIFLMRQIVIVALLSLHYLRRINLQNIYDKYLFCKLVLLTRFCSMLCTVYM